MCAMPTEFDWTPERKSEPSPWLSVEPSEVLYEYDGPRLFTTSEEPWMYLWYLCDEASSAQRFIVAPTSDHVVSQLKAGVMTVREAISLPGTRVVEVHNAKDAPLEHWRVSFDELPEQILPKRHVMLRPSLAPLLSLRMTGQLEPGKVPISAIKRSIDGAYTALKRLAEVSLAVGAASGRPTHSLRRLFDLPTQRLAFGSIEIAFSKKHEGDLTELMEPQDQSKTDAMAATLTRALEQVHLGRNLQEVPVSLLEIMEKLAPPPDGPVQAVEIRGSLLTKQSNYVLTRPVADSLRAAIRSVRKDSEQLHVFSGTVREFDKDRFSFTLRNSEGGDIASFSVDDEKYGEAYEFFLSGENCHIVGRKGASSTYQAIVFSSEPIEAIRPGLPLLSESGDEG